MSENNVRDTAASGPAFQDQICDNHCFGCGPANDRGLQIKSYWSGKDEAVCRFSPEDHHNAGPKQILNGGIIATLIDCHCVCTAIAEAYRREGRSIGSGDPIWYATGNLNVSYLRPAPLAGPVELYAQIRAAGAKKTVLDCRVVAGGQECATGEVIAVRVPLGWRKEDAG